MLATDFNTCISSGKLLFLIKYINKIMFLKNKFGFIEKNLELLFFVSLDILLNFLADANGAENLIWDR